LTRLSSKFNYARLAESILNEARIRSRFATHPGDEINALIGRIGATISVDQPSGCPPIRSGKNSECRGVEERTSLDVSMKSGVNLETVKKVTIKDESIEHVVGRKNVNR